MNDLFFQYRLPKELIAQTPARKRDHSRLLSLNRSTGDLQHHVFHDIVSILNPGDRLVLNNTKVFPARINGKRATGGRVKVLLVRHLSDTRWIALLDTSRRLKSGEQLFFEEGLACQITGERNNGKWPLTFNRNIEEYLVRHGSTPLPPYIKRDEGLSTEDTERYQTVYASQTGAIAAPTAGLHFTDHLLEQLHIRKIDISFVTLHVGIGTFKPMQTDCIDEHVMDAEHYKIPQTTIKEITQTRARGKRVICVGTTSCRALESYAQTRSLNGSTNLFIKPPYTFQMIDGLITNFHLPKSTLLLLVSAFAGSTHIRKAYQEAIDHQYAFYSYGDAMIII